MYGEEEHEIQHIPNHDRGRASHQRNLKTEPTDD